MLFVIHANTRGALSITSRGPAHLLRLTKDVSFFSKATLRRYLGRVQPGDALVIDGSRCVFVDRDIREAIDDFTAHAAARGITVELRSMPAANVASAASSRPSRSPSPRPTSPRSPTRSATA